MLHAKRFVTSHFRVIQRDKLNYAIDACNAAFNNALIDKRDALIEALPDLQQRFGLEYFNEAVKSLSDRVAIIKKNQMKAARQLTTTTAYVDQLNQLDFVAMIETDLPTLRADAEKRAAAEGEAVHQATVVENIDPSQDFILDDVFPSIPNVETSSEEINYLEQIENLNKKLEDAWREKSEQDDEFRKLLERLAAEEQHNVESKKRQEAAVKAQEQLCALLSAQSTINLELKKQLESLNQKNAEMAQEKIVLEAQFKTSQGVVSTFKRVSEFAWDGLRTFVNALLTPLTSMIPTYEQVSVPTKKVVSIGVEAISGLIPSADILTWAFKANSTSNPEVKANTDEIPSKKSSLAPTP